MRTGWKTEAQRAECGGSFLLGVIALASWAQASQAAEPAAANPPPFLHQAVCRPTLMIDGQEKHTGTAFLTQTADDKPRRVLVMAHHLFDMSGHARMSSSEMPTRALSAACRTLDAKQVWTAGAAFVVEGAHSLGGLDSLRDIAVMPIMGDAPGADMPVPLKLAPSPPVTGDTVWLLAQTADQDASGNFLHRAHVVQDGGFLAFAYDDKALKLRETSGAPIVDVHGDVVGVNVGYIARNGALIGVADTLATIQTALLDVPAAP